MPVMMQNYLIDSNTILRKNGLFYQFTMIGTVLVLSNGRINVLLPGIGMLFILLIILFTLVPRTKTARTMHTFAGSGISVVTRGNSCYK